MPCYDHRYPAKGLQLSNRPPPPLFLLPHSVNQPRFGESPVARHFERGALLASEQSVNGRGMDM
jgi:hypothetical protein